MPINWKSPRATYLLLEVDGRQFDFFKDYSVQIDLLNPGGEFDFDASLHVGKRGVRENLGPQGLAPGRKVQVRLVTPYGQTLQHTGRIFDVIYDVSERGGSSIKVVVRDHMHGIVHADALPGLALDNVTFADVIRTVAYPFGFSPSDITIDTDAARNLMTGKPAAGTSLSTKAPLDIESMKIDQAQPHAGENALAYLQRHAKRFGLMIWGTADGKIVVGRPNYDQKPRYNFVCKQGYKGTANNVHSIRRKLSFSQRPSAVHVYGKTHGGDVSRSPVHEVVYDDEIRNAGIYAPITVHDNNAKDATQARERAQWELGHRRQTADVVQLSAPYHCANDGSVYAIDTIAHVQFDAAGLDTDLYVVRRTFEASSQSGTSTSIDLVPKYALMLGEGITSAPTPKFEQSRGIPPKKTEDELPGPIVGPLKKPRVILAPDPIGTDFSKTVY